MLHGWRRTAGIENPVPPPPGRGLGGGQAPEDLGPPAKQQALDLGFAPVDGADDTPSPNPSQGEGGRNAPSPGPSQREGGQKAESSFRGFVEDVLHDSGLHDFYANDKSDPDQERLANLGELISSAQQFEEEYLFEFENDAPPEANAEAAPADAGGKAAGVPRAVALVSDADAIDPEQGAVTLMTLHAAKGLEFHAVAMLGVEDGMLPHSRANDDPDELEEERRLAFVGITRAERRLFLLHARTRTVFGQTQPAIRSRFLRRAARRLLRAGGRLTGRGRLSPTGAMPGRSGGITAGTAQRSAAARGGRPLPPRHAGETPAVRRRPHRPRRPQRRPHPSVDRLQVRRRQNPDPAVRAAGARR